MSLSVEDRSRSIGALRFVEVRLMETAAAWTPTTPEMEVKILLGKHIWDFAQHADWLGKRAFELRRPLQFTLEPVPEYRALLAEVAGLSATSERLASLYDALLAGLEQRYRSYLATTDELLDGPSVVAMERILNDISRQRSEANTLRRDLGIAAADTRSLVEREKAVANIAPNEG